MTPYDFLEQATASIHSNRQAREVRQELLSHLYLKQAKLEEHGIDPGQAEMDALRSMGDPAAMAADYAVPETRLKWVGVFLGGIPLFITAVLSMGGHADGILMWLVVLGTMAVIMEPGRTLANRLRGLWRIVQ